jgi:asparagine synthase (glutamine-hydrolysing)
MCGIVGLLAPEGLERYRASLQAASDVAAYRGPDGEGFVALDSDARHAVRVRRLDEPGAADLAGRTLALGHRRLSIIDLSENAAQPMADRSGSCWLAFNGEIYNYLEIARELEREGASFRTASDTEVLLEAYRAWGERCVERFVGMWAFAIADARTRTLFCSRDRFGIKPLHYHSGGGRFAFGSEVKQLLELPFVARRPHAGAVYDFLVYGAVDHSGNGFFEGIRKLPPGHNLTVDLRTGVVREERYYAPAIAAGSARVDSLGAARELRRLLDESVRLHLRSDVEVGSCLSGGLDSSSIVGLIHDRLLAEGRHGIQRTFTSHFAEPDADELAYAEAVIARTGVRAATICPTVEELARELPRIVWHQEEPFGSTSIFAQWKVFELVARNGVKVVLDGQGADEMLGGYLGLFPTFLDELGAQGRYGRLIWEAWRFGQRQGLGAAAIARSVRAATRRPAVGGVPAAAEVPDWLDPALASAEAARSEARRLRAERPFGDRAPFSNQLAQMTLAGNLPGLLRYEDRNSMARSVEARVPFLDHRLVEFCLRLPATVKIRDGWTKWPLREGMKGTLPEVVRRRSTKLGFATPHARWQAGPLAPVVEDVLASGVLGGWVRSDVARERAREIAATGASDFAPWRWASLGLWLRRFGLDAGRGRDA